MRRWEGRPDLTGAGREGDAFRELSASRRLPKEWDVPGVQPSEPTRLGEVVWLEPLPDAFLQGAIDAPLGPEARYEQTESI